MDENGLRGVTQIQLWVSFGVIIIIIIIIFIIIIVFGYLKKEGEKESEKFGAYFYSRRGFVEN